MNFTRANRCLLFALVFSLGVRSLIQPARGQPTEEVRSADNETLLFESDGVLEMELAADFSALLKDRGEQRSEHPATLSYTEPDGTPGELAIQLRTRGNFRLEARNCDFPPLRLNFKQGDAEHTVFAGQDKLKLVTHCRTGKTQFEQQMLQEFLAYRVYNQLTELSFRVRLARISYVDTAGKRKPSTRFAFLIEDEDRMAQRNIGVVFEIQRFSLTLTEPAQSALFALI